MKQKIMYCFDAGTCFVEGNIVVLLRCNATETSVLKH